MALQLNLSKYSSAQMMTTCTLELPWSLPLVEHEQPSLEHTQTLILETKMADSKGLEVVQGIVENATAPLLLLPPPLIV